MTPLPPVPPPPTPPDVSEEHDQQEDEPLQTIEPSSKNIVALAKQYKVVYDGNNRKFGFKTYGSQELALRASEAFYVQVRSMVYEFDSHQRRPQERKDLLKTVGCDEKFLQQKSSIATQRGALLRRIFNGAVEFIEQRVVNNVVGHLAQDMNTDSISMVPSDDGFLASFQGEQHSIKKSFSSLLDGFNWLKSLAIAEKARLTTISFLYKNVI